MLSQVPETRFAGVQQGEWEEGIAWSGGGGEQEGSGGAAGGACEPEVESEDEVEGESAAPAPSLLPGCAAAPDGACCVSAR
jgi:hypothetical protein